MAPLIAVVYNRPSNLPDLTVAKFRTNMAWADKLIEIPIPAGRLRPAETPYGITQARAVRKARLPYGSWIVVASPYERWSARAGQRIRQIAADQRRRIITLPVRELWAPDRYRTDGPWGRMRAARVFPYLAGQTFARRNHAAPVPIDPGYQRVHLDDVAIYRFENVHVAGRRERAMIAEARRPGSLHRYRASRRWARRDPNRRYARAHGYGYLADGRGARMRGVPAGDLWPEVGYQHIPRATPGAWRRAGTSWARMNTWLDGALAQRKGRRRP